MPWLTCLMIGYAMKKPNVFNGKAAKDFGCWVMDRAGSTGYGMKCKCFGCQAYKDWENDRCNVEHRDAKTACQGRYRARKKDAVWVDTEMLRRIETEFLKEIPKGWHLEHIHPLSTGGLHWVGNWSAAPAHENHAKNNTYIGLTPSARTFNEVMEGKYRWSEYQYREVTDMPSPPRSL